MAFKLPLLSLLMPLLAAHLGLHGDIAALMLALWMHEIAHIFAARMAGVRIVEICLMPFGGSAQMENPYQLPSYRIIPVAAAGPGANLALAMLIAFAAHWSWIGVELARACIQPNLLLLLFNLLPALPLDGGRMLYAVLERPLGEERALRIGLYLGRLLAFALFACAVAGGMRTGCWNITLMLAAIFILASERDERNALLKSRATRMEEQLRTPSAPQIVRLYQADVQTPLQSALSLLRAQEGTWFLLLQNGRPQRLLDGRNIVSFLLKHNAPETTLGELPCGLSLCALSDAEKTI